MAVLGIESKEKEEPQDDVQILPECLQSGGKPEQLPMDGSKVKYSSDGFLGKLHHLNQLRYLEVFAAGWKIP